MYFITFSEMLGTDGKRIAKHAAKKMYFPFYADEELFKTADEMGFLPDAKNVDEKGPPFFDRWFTEKPKIHLERLQSVIYEVAKKGDGVFFGRGSQLLLKSFKCALHVLVIGSMEKRIERVMEENKVGKEVAEKLIERSDHDKRGFLRFAFDEDWLNPHLYDLVLNTDKLSIESAADLVIGAAKSDGVKSCGIDSVKELGILSLHRKAESALLEAGIMTPYLFVEAEDADTLRIYGIVSSGDEKGVIEDVIKKIKGVKKIFNDLKVSPAAITGV